MATIAPMEDKRVGSIARAESAAAVPVDPEGCPLALPSRFCVKFGTEPRVSRLLR